MADRRKVMDNALRAAAAVPEDDGTACFPHPAEVPDWSPETVLLLGRLTALERAVVEWYVAGGNAAEAYRQAKGIEYADRETDTTRKNGYSIMARPRVKAAVDAAMKDRNFNARCDLEWKLAKIRKAMARCEKMESLQAQQALVDMALKLATLQGEIKKDDNGGLDKRGNVHIRILEIVAQACGVQPGPEGAYRPGAVGTAARTAHPAVGADQRPAVNGVADRGG